MLQGRATDKHCILESFCFQKELELKMNAKRGASDSNFDYFYFLSSCTLNYFLRKRKENNPQFVTFLLLSQWGFFSSFKIFTITFA